MSKLKFMKDLSKNKRLAKPINWALLGHRVKYLLRGQQALRLWLKHNPIHDHPDTLREIHE